MTVGITQESRNTLGAELFDPDEDCSTDESVGGDPEGRCALVPDERCTLRCHIRYLENEPQDNDWLMDNRPYPSSTAEEATK